MKLKTIWTLPSMSLTERLRRTRDMLSMELAYRIPIRLRFWATIHNINYVAKKTNAVVGDITVIDLMHHMPAPKDIE